ncbi:MAG TPA: hypothetical protein VIK28_11300, partial [Sedimentisphaerales bacterium]
EMVFFHTVQIYRSCNAPASITTTGGQSLKTNHTSRPFVSSGQRTCLSCCKHSLPENHSGVSFPA